jgi:DNA-binding transcriptional MocR family regulator
VFHPPDAVAEPLVRLFPQDAYRLASDRDWSGFAREFMNGDEGLREDPALRRAYQKYLLQRAWSCWLKKAA